MRAALFFLILGVLLPHSLSAQRVVRYGADFLASGAGARALGMGSAYVALASDVTAGYWNPAGLTGVTGLEVVYMHVERFAGVVSFDYAGVAIPLSAQTSLAIALFRSGVNDIKNTLDAWDGERGLPRPQAEDLVTTFSVADYAFFVSFGRRVQEHLAWGVSGKIIRRTLGPFASAWGYSMDVGIQFRQRNWRIGATLQDATTMLQSWSVNREKLQALEGVFGLPLPEGGTELVLPVLRLGGAYQRKWNELRVIASVDVDLAFEGRKAYALHTGPVSYHPRLGVEAMYRERIALRGGLNQWVVGPDGFSVSPSVGAGLVLRRWYIDYSFGHFAGLAAELGFSHRLSVRVVILH